MDASTALTELVGLSTQVVEAVIAGPGGDIEAAHAGSDARARSLAATASKLLSEAGELRSGARVERVQVDLARGSVVVVRDAERTIVATTVAEPVGGLVAYDLRAALRRARGDGA
jgi:predicted regulator of Ras-like GTPase activity (Roadblock/LC7/MglB family)